MSEENIINEIEALLQKFELKESDFGKEEKIPGVKAPAHDKIRDEIAEYWSEKHPFIEKYSSHGMDFLGRTSSEGPILLAVEIDSRGWRVVDSCVKLTDIRSPNKIWIYVTNSPMAKKEFVDAVKQIQKLLRIRSEDKETLGNFVAFLKTPNLKDFEKVIIL